MALLIHYLWCDVTWSQVFFGTQASNGNLSIISRSTTNGASDCGTGDDPSQFVKLSSLDYSVKVWRFVALFLFE